MFGFTSPLTIDHTKVPSTQTNFPVLVNITDARLKTVGNGGNVEDSNGYDIVFAGGGFLKWEVERYNGSTGELVAWVKIPSLSSSSDTVINLLYGDSEITTDQSDPTNVWTNSFLGVYHLKDGSSLSVASSTGSNNGSNNGATATTGQIDGGASFASASSQYIDLGSGINPTAITLSAWVNATSFPNTYNSVIARTSVPSNAFLFVKSTGKLACGCIVATGPTQKIYDGTGSHTLSTGTWYYLTMVYDSSVGLIGYVDASSDGTDTAGGNLTTNSSSMSIGRDPTTAGRLWNGKLDEVRVANVARSANWITTEYNNQSDPGSFMSLGSEVEIGGGGAAEVEAFASGW